MLCRVLLHAVNLRHGTDGFTSPPKEVRGTDFYRPEKSTVLGRVDLLQFCYAYTDRGIVQNGEVVKGGNWYSVPTRMKEQFWTI
jgi:hypothetical protein